MAGKGGEKPYALLRRVLDESNKVAVAHIVMHGRQHLCVVAPNDQFLMLLTLRFAGEILPPATARSAAGKAPTVSAAELAMAKQVVAGMSGPFNPAQFKDTYKSDLLRRIKEKIKKKQTHSVDAEEPEQAPRPKVEVIDLMAALKNSLKMKGRRSA